MLLYHRTGQLAPMKASVSSRVHGSRTVLKAVGGLHGTGFASFSLPPISVPGSLLLLCGSPLASHGSRALVLLEVGVGLVAKVPIVTHPRSVGSPHFVLSSIVL